MQTQISSQLHQQVEDVICEAMNLGNRKEIEALVQAHQEGENVVADAPDREYAAVSASVSWGYTGGNMQGWLTFASTKVYFSATSITFHENFFAGGGAFPTVAVLKPELLKGKTGSFKFYEDSRGNERMQMFLDGKDVLGASLLIWGVGLGRKLEGRVHFT